LNRRSLVTGVLTSAVAIPLVGQSEGPAQAAVESFNVVEFGAKGDGKQPATESIQRAIDACAAVGGGVVYVPKGDYLCLTLELKSNVNLYLAAEARIVATGKGEDYAGMGAVLFARNARNIAVTGQGGVDGRGRGTKEHRYKIIHFQACRDISLIGVELRDSAGWCTHLSECSGVYIHAVRIDSAVNVNNDGFDIDSCENVTISDCRLRCGDDAIALKTNTVMPCRNITITNCIISTRWAAFRFGPEAKGNFENIAVTNCVIHDTFGCGIKLQMNEGAEMKDIVFDNLVMENVTGPISLRLANWVGGSIERSGNENRRIGTFNNVQFSNIRARVSQTAQPKLFGMGEPLPGEERSCISITGLPGHPVEAITFSNIDITFPGGGTSEEAARRDVPDMRDTYPEYFMFGVLPAYGLYAHHVRGLTLQNIRFSLASADQRPAIVCDDAEDLEIANLRAEGNSNAECLLRLQNMRGAFVHGSRPLSQVSAFVRVEGAQSQGITLTSNDLRLASKPSEVSGDAHNDAVIEISNVTGGNL